MDTKRQNQRNKLKIMYNLSLKIFIMKRYIFNLMIMAVMALSLFSACMKFNINEPKENNSRKEQRDDNSGKPDDNKEIEDQGKQEFPRHATGLVIDPKRNI